MWNKDKSEVNNNYELHFTKPIEMGYVCSEQVKKLFTTELTKCTSQYIFTESYLGMHTTVQNDVIEI